MPPTQTDSHAVPVMMLMPKGYALPDLVTCVTRSVHKPGATPVEAFAEYMTLHGDSNFSAAGTWPAGPFEKAPPVCEPIYRCASYGACHEPVKVGRVLCP